MHLLSQCRAQPTRNMQDCKEALMDAARFLEEELSVANAIFSIEIVDTERGNRISHTSGIRPVDEKAS